MNELVLIKFFRLLRGMSQFQLSLDAQIPSYRLSILENGRDEPAEDELARLALALEATPERLRGSISEDSLVSA